MVQFVDDHRATYGVEPICAVLPIAPSTYFLHHARQVDPTQRPARAKRDDDLRIAIQRVWDANWQVYGPRKVWQQLGREDVRRALERLDGHGPRSAAAHGSRRPTPRPLACVPRIWSIASSRDAAQSALGLRLHLRRHVERRVCRVRDRCLLAAHRRLARVGVAADGLVLDALEQAVCDRGADRVSGLVHHSDRGTQYLSCGTPTGSPTPGSRRRSAAAATRMTMPSPSR